MQRAKRQKSAAVEQARRLVWLGEGIEGQAKTKVALEALSDATAVFIRLSQIERQGTAPVHQKVAKIHHTLLQLYWRGFQAGLAVRRARTQRSADSADAAVLRLYAKKPLLTRDQVLVYLNKKRGKRLMYPLPNNRFGRLVKKRAHELGLEADWLSWKDDTEEAPIKAALDVYLSRLRKRSDPAAFHDGLLTAHNSRRRRAKRVRQERGE